MYVGPRTFKADRNRRILEIIVTNANVSISLGGGNGLIHLSMSNPYRPIIVPTSQIVVAGTGTYTVVSNAMDVE
jgi:hypothetical protein